jgi:hypothetical protein
LSIHQNLTTNENRGEIRDARNQQRPDRQAIKRPSRMAHTGLGAAAAIGMLLGPIVGRRG